MPGDTSRKAIGRRIEQVRKQNSLSQSDFAKEVGVPLSMLIDLERGNIELAENAALLISMKYDVTANYLYLGE